jgi:phosphoglycolate phosphatase
VVAIVSNNCAPAIEMYLRMHRLGTLIANVQGPDPADADLMKPHAHLLHTALIALGAAASESVYVGDAVTDVAAASDAGMPCIGYANKPGKTQRLKESGAALVATDMRELAALL